MNIKIIALGKIKEKFLKDGIEEFLKRLTPYTSIEIIELQPIEIKDEHLTEKTLMQEGEKILAIIGPEGGFSQKEFDYFRSKNLPLISLGDLILKAETAVIVALGDIIYEYQG